jgi:SSS family solute:Na+ symporter
MKDVGGWHQMTEKLQVVALDPAALHLKDAGTHYAANAWTSAWTPLLSGSSNNPMGVDIFAMVFGLGFVLSFGYWCTNFLVVQRAMAAKNMTAARNTPLVAAVPKMLFPFLVIVPGMIAVALTAMPDKNYRIPPPVIEQAAYLQAVDAFKNAGTGTPDAVATAVSTALGKKVDATRIGALVTENAASKLSDEAIEKGIYNAVAEYDYDGVILSLVKKYCPPGMLGLALTALLASFMSGMAGNVTAFNTVWTYDLYQAYLVPGKSDSHYFWTGKLTTVFGILLSICAAYFASLYSNAMDVIQLVFSFVNAPLFATFLLGMFWARTTGTGAFLGLFGGIGASAIVHGLTVAEGKGGWLGQQLFVFPSTMAQNFWLAAIAFIVCFTLTLVISLLTQRTKSDNELKGLVYSLTPFFQQPGVVGVILLIGCVILNFIFW